MQEHLILAEARDKGLPRYFTGKPCKHGHVAYRLTSNATCSECQKLTNAAQPPENQRARHLRNRYGLTVAMYEAMLEAQHEACAICRQHFVDTPHVDHCHSTGKVRGLLCTQCNTAIGKFNDDPELLRRAIAYLTGC